MAHGARRRDRHQPERDRERACVDLPADGETPAKTINGVDARPAAGAGPAGGLQKATFGGRVDYREARAARGQAGRPSIARRSPTTAHRHTKPGFGDLEQAEFHSNVKFVDGPQTTADAPLGDLPGRAGRLDLSPSSNDPGRRPTVTNGQLIVHARTISMTMATQLLKADTDVRSVMDRKAEPAKAPGGRGEAPDERERDKAAVAAETGSAGRPSEPTGSSTMARSRTRNYDRQRATDTARRHRAARRDSHRRSTTTGNLTGRRQGAYQDDARRRRPEDRGEDATETIGNSDVFVYEDAKRLATYTEPAPCSRISSARPGTSPADSIDLFFKEGRASWTASKPRAT